MIYKQRITTYITLLSTSLSGPTVPVDSSAPAYIFDSISISAIDNDYDRSHMLYLIEVG